MTSKAWTFGVAATAALLGGSVVPAMHALTPHPATITHEVVVPCAAEDSCTVDYRHGAWHIAPDPNH